MTTRYSPTAWSTLPRGWDNNADGWPEHRRDALHEIVLLDNKVESIFETACCTGHYIKRLREIGYPGTYLGIDITPEFVIEARKLHPNEVFEICDIRDLPLFWRSPRPLFDLTLVTGILQHLSPEDLPDALSEVALVTEKYLLLSYTQAEETKITFDGKFFQNYYSEEYMRGLVPEDFEVETYRNVGRFATVLLKRKK